MKRVVGSKGFQVIIFKPLSVQLPVCVCASRASMSTGSVMYSHITTYNGHMLEMSLSDRQCSHLMQPRKKETGDFIFPKTYVAVTSQSGDEGRQMRGDKSWLIYVVGINLVSDENTHHDFPGY